MGTITSHTLNKITPIFCGCSSAMSFMFAIIDGINRFISNNIFSYDLVLVIPMQLVFRGIACVESFLLMGRLIDCVGYSIFLVLIESYKVI